MLMSGEVGSLSELARREDLTDRYVRHILPLAYLAPDIVETILDGRHRPSLTINTLRDIAASDWPSQRAAL